MNNHMKAVGVIVGLLLAIIVGVLIYYETQSSINEFGEVIERDTSDASGTAYTDTTNASAWTAGLDNSPLNAANVNVTCVNMTAGAESYPTFTVNFKTINVAADAANNFTQVNITYTSHLASDEDSTTTMAATVFNLLPIIALAVLASLLLAAVLIFSGKKSGGL